MNHEATLLALIVKNENILYLADLRKEFFTQGVTRAFFGAMEAALQNNGYLSRDTIRAELHDPDIFDHVLKEADEDYSFRWQNLRGKIVENWKRQAIKDVFTEAREALDSDAPDDVARTIIEDVQLIQSEQTEHYDTQYGDVLKQVIEVIESRYNATSPLPGLSVGIRMLDGVIGGLQKRRYYLVGARPSQAKSALLGQIADHIARSNTPVGYFSLESQSQELVMRNVARSQGIEMHRLQSGQLVPVHFAGLNTEVEQYRNIPLYIDDTRKATIGHIESKARLWKVKYDIQALFVDYVQIATRPGSWDKRDEVEQISRALKDLSITLDIPVVAAAQLRRDVDNREPHLGDFQHTSALEQDADVAIVLHWKESYGDEVPVEAIIAKNRDGRKDRVPLTFHAPIMKMVERPIDGIELGDLEGNE